MKTNKQRKSAILEAVHETATDLRTAGFISKRRMHEYDALCLAPIRRYSQSKIRSSLRNVTGLARPFWRRF